MTKKYSIIGVIIFILVAIVAWNGVSTRNSSTNEKTKVEEAAESPTLETQSSTETNNGDKETDLSDRTYTLSDITKHSNSSSCWTAIDGEVFDLTEWIDEHPGGAENIQKICGKDGTSAFSSQHRGAERPERELAKYGIGVLAD